MAEEYYFPNVSPHSLDLERRLRAVAALLPEAERCTLYEVLSQGHDAFLPTSFAIDDDAFAVIKQNGEAIAFPRPIPMVKFSHIVCGYRAWLQRKYTLPGFVAVETGDTVVDCGAYVGGFSLSAGEAAGQLHAFEPAPANFACLARNIGGYPRAMLNQIGLYSRSQTMKLNMSASSVEHSLLTPDDGEPIEQREIEVISLADYCASRAIPQIDFLKLEAEGVELEIFEGLAGLTPRKLAIDVSPEREGQSPAAEFQALLSKLGYEWRQRGHVLFARMAP